MVVKKRTIMYIFIIVVLGLFVFFLFNFKTKIGRIISPFFLAIIVSYLINPIVTKLETKKIPRRLGIILVYLVFAILITGMTVFIVPEFINNTKELMNTLPNITTKYQDMFNGFILFVQSSKWPGEIKNMLFNEIQNTAASIQEIAVNTLKRFLGSIVGTVTVFFDFLLAMLIAYYFIKDTDAFKSNLLSLTPRKWRNGIVNTGREINTVLTNFIRGQLLIALIVGATESIGLTLVNVKYSLVLGFIGGLANIIPYFGPIIGAAPAVAVALIDSPLKALEAIAVFVIVQQIDNMFISTKIIEGKLGLHPVTTILAVLVGGEFFGIAGMLFSVPVAAILKVIVKRAIEAIV